MHALFIVLTCFAGAFEFAFLVAGILGLHDFEPPKNRRNAVFQFIDAMIFRGHWLRRPQPGLRRLGFTRSTGVVWLPGASYGLRV